MAGAFTRRAEACLFGRRGVVPFALGFLVDEERGVVVVVVDEEKKGGCGLVRKTGAARRTHVRMAIRVLFIIPRPIINSF